MKLKSKFMSTTMSLMMLVSTVSVSMANTNTGPVPSPIEAGAVVDPKNVDASVSPINEEEYQEDLKYTSIVTDAKLYVYHTKDGGSVELIDQNLVGETFPIGTGYRVFNAKESDGWVFKGWNYSLTKDGKDLGNPKSFLGYYTFSKDRKSLSIEYDKTSRTISVNRIKSHVEVVGQPVIYSVRAKFNPTIEATSEENGTISDKGKIDLDWGTSKSYNITAKDGYIISDIIVDGDHISEGKGKNTFKYTFDKVVKPHKINVRFEMVKEEPKNPKNPKAPQNPKEPKTPKKPQNPGKSSSRNRRSTYHPVKRGSRIAGKDRIDTAIEISKKYYNKSDSVLVVRSDLFPDSMTSSTLAKLKDAPILLNPSKELDKRVSDEIKRLGAKEIIVVGGKASISDQVINSLSAFDADKNVERISGTDRYETSEKVARKVMTIAKNSGKAVVASGEDFPDALTAGAFASREGYPILLVRKNDIPNQIKRALTDLGIKETYIAGGYKMVSKSVESNIPKAIERLAGKNRYETSIEIAKSKFKNSTETFVASGEGFADALVISPIAGKYNASVLLVNKTDNNDKVKDYISNFGIDRITGVGGESSIPEKVLYGLIK